MMRTAKFGRRTTSAVLTFVMMSAGGLPSTCAWTAIVARIVVMIKVNAHSRSVNVAGMLGKGFLWRWICLAWLCDR